MSVWGFHQVLGLIPHCHRVLTQGFLVTNWETHLLWIGSLGESWDELGNVDLAGVLLDVGVEGQGNHSATLSASKFKEHY